MLFLTDLDYTEETGHSIAEVEIYGTGIHYLDYLSMNIFIFGANLVFQCPMAVNHVF